MLKNPKACTTSAQNNIKRIGYTGLLGITTPETKSVWDSGIDMTYDTFFQIHVTKMVTKSRMPSGCILRIWKTREKETMMVFWTILVFKLLVICHQLWPTNSVKLTADFVKLKSDLDDFLLKENRFIATAQLRGKAETAKTLPPGEKSGEICSNINLEDPRRDFAKCWHWKLHKC